MSLSLAAPLQGPVTLRLPFAHESAAEVRRALSSWLAHRGSSDQAIGDACLVATELVSNALRHAGPLADSRLLVRWHEDEADLLLLSVCDGGGSSTPTVVDAPVDAESGRGMAIVEALARRWRVERSEDGHEVQVHLAI